MTLPRICVNENQRFLTLETGEPFFWLGDTAWELFHRLSEAEAAHYLDVRAAQGFNVIQAVVLGELDGLRTPNANGHIPLCGDDPARPNEFYFRHVDAIVRLAAERGLYIALLPTWGDKVCGELWGTGPVVFDEGNARLYGRYLGERYRDDANIVWMLGGDRPGRGYEDLWSEMAGGVEDGLGGRPFCTYHPRGGASSSDPFHDALWLDMNLLQSGHCMNDAPVWEMIRADYERKPAKPVLDGEPNYEDHPRDPYLRTWRPEFGRFDDHDCRKQAYRAVFAGACGHTYGHHSVWQMWSRERIPVTFAMPPWDEAIHRPGARQMVHLRNLMLSRPYFSRIPGGDLLPDVQPPPPPASNEDRENSARAAHAVATKCADGSFAMIYFPLASQRLRVSLKPFGPTANAWWFDPRTGESHRVGVLSGEGESACVEITSPLGGPDWVLVLDHTRESFAPPGTR